MIIKASLKMSQMPIYIESAVDYHDYQRLNHATFIFWGEPCKVEAREADDDDVKENSGTKCCRWEIGGRR